MSSVSAAAVKIVGTPKQGLAGATLGFFVGFAAVALFGPSATKFEDAMGLSAVQVGLLVAMPSLSGSLLRIPFSAWVDTTGGRKPFLTLLGISIVGMAGLTIVVAGFYPDDMDGLYPVLLFLGLLSGSGIATFSVGISQVSYWYPQARQGTALGAYAGIGNIAPGLFSFLIPVALAGLGLGGSYLIWLAFLTAGTIVYFRIGRNSPYFQLRTEGVPAAEARQVATERGQELFPAARLIDSLKISARVWRTWVLVILYFTTFGGFIALTAWLPTYWKSFFDAGTFEAGSLTAAFSIGASVVRIYGGRIADRFGGELTAIGALSTMLVGALVMTFSGTYALSVVGELVMALGMGVGNAAVFKLVPQEVPDAVGGAAGWVGGLGAFGGFAIPPGMALFVSGDAGYDTGFVIFVGLAILCLSLATILLRSRGTTAMSEIPLKPAEAEQAETEPTERPAQRISR
jgi:MFS transporter, NNP family, nitrate/nitrite transporter